MRCTATRDLASVGLRDLARYVTWGASPRASINMILAAKALAVLRGREYAVPEDVRDLALDVLRHRMTLSYEALADGVRADDLVVRVLASVRMPDAPMYERRAVASPTTQAPIPGPSAPLYPAPAPGPSSHGSDNFWAPGNS
jgi:MoxR-like ATPase